jgi:alpha-1,3-rhamnosyl/mannosyltransferase
LVTVGINAAPLLAPRTGVGRYIAGLLSGLDGLQRPPGGPWTYQPLFATRAPGSRWSPLGVVRRIGKALPGGYALADAARAAAIASLRRGGRLTLYHETNHAAPHFTGPVVLTVHDLSTIRFPETQEPARARHFAKALRGRARFAERVVVPTAAIGREVQESLGVDPSRLVVAHHGIEARFTPGSRSVPEVLAARGVRAPYLLFVGAQDARKGLPELLEAMAALPAALRREHALVLAGPRGTASRTLRIPSQVQVVDLGFVPDEELPAFYRGAAALCLPSRYEGFGFPLAEAMACGVACVASDDPALVEVAGGAALHFPRGDVHTLSKAIESVTASSGVRADLERRGPPRAAAFTWAASAHAHVQAYRGALEEEADA